MKELRDLFANKSELNEKRKQLKAKALEKREDVSAEELDAAIAEIKEIDEKLKEIETKISEAREAEASKEQDASEEDVEQENKDNQKEERIMKNTINYNENMKREEIFETREYATAFFKRLQGKALDEKEIKIMDRAMSSGNGSVGAAIPTQTMDMIIGQFSEGSGLLSDIEILHIPELISIPKEDVVNDANWIAETAESTDGDDTLTNIALAAYKLIRTVSISAHVSAMSISAFEKWLVNNLTKKMRAALSNAIVNGTGSGQPTGIEKSTFTKDVNLVEVTTLSEDALVDAEALMDEDLVANAKFYMNRKMFAAVRKLKDSNKRPLFERLVEDGARGNLIGYPVKLDKYVPANTIYMADAKSAYVMNFAKDIEIANSKEAGFRSGNTVYRSLALVDGKPTEVAGALVKISVTTAE
ncbi:MAG: phage major capsid protein [Candidatus Caccovivens sp.]